MEKKLRERKTFQLHSVKYELVNRYNSLNNQNNKHTGAGRIQNMWFFYEHELLSY